MRYTVRSLIVVVFLAMTGTSVAAVSRLHDARLWDSPDKTRVVFDLSKDARPDIFMVEDPLRLVIDLPNTRSIQRAVGDADQSHLIKQIRTGVHKGTGLRIVLDLNQMVSPKSFMLEPDAQHAYRLVVDLYRQGATVPKTQLASKSRDTSTTELEAGDDSATTAEKTAAAMAQAAASQAPDTRVADSNAVVPPAAIARASNAPIHDIVVAIDAGHGGKDPGAHGPHGTQEKDVTLAIAKRLQKLVDDQPHMHAVLTRKGDHYVGLRQRMDIARRDKADFFVSIHCDASPGGGNASGASVYALSPHGATSEHARWLARKENAADMVGGISLKDKNSSLASFMLDLSQSASVEASLDAGKRVLAQLDNLGSLHKTQVQQAGFMVLKSPDIPSILVETNFISNSAEERKLASAGYQNALAGALLRGIKGYFSIYRPASFIAAEQEHRVRSGETLSEIAQTYGVSVTALRRYNDLNGNQIEIGRTLRIPAPNPQLARLD